MRKILFSTFFLLSAALSAADYMPADYTWDTQSHNSSGSMPCGGGDVGMNVWVEKGDLMLYIAQSGWFDENNTLLKAGRWRLHFDGDPFGQDHFRQTLCLADGSVVVSGRDLEVRIWADVFFPTVYIDLNSNKARPARVSYESWRYRDRQVTKAECQQCSYKWLIPKDCMTRADQITADGGTLSFIHENTGKTVFDYTVSYEQLDSIKEQLYDPLAHRRMTGVMRLPGFTFTGTSDSIYASTDYRAWHYDCHRLRRSTISITLDSGDPAHGTPPANAKASRKRSTRWWHDFWQRSWIIAGENQPEAAHILRNYELFRYMLGCNAYGHWPTKFNGGLFTFDPVYVEQAGDDGQPVNPFTPDYRKWGGGTMTAQNQRLVYWPMLKSGDIDLMAAQWDTYLRLLPAAVARTRHYWNHGGASFTEQLENFGLPNPAEYGKHPAGTDPGVERNAWLEYEWDTALEFCLMILQAKEYAAGDYSRYDPLIAECLRFFDEHYQYEARRMGAKALNSDGKLIIYPGSACETYKMAYNPSSTVAALQAVTARYPGTPLDPERIPDLPLQVIQGDTCIAPAVVWARIQNTETPQLYPVFPWRIYGLGRPGLQTAINTYQKDSHAIAMRDSKGWKQDNIWAACLGLTEEARRLAIAKWADGPYRFPAFWEPGFDWAPDHNRGGAAMTGLQEMLLQESPSAELILFGAWPKEWDVSFRLHATGGRVVEGTLRHGVATHHIVTTH